MKIEITEALLPVSKEDLQAEVLAGAKAACLSYSGLPQLSYDPSAISVFAGRLYEYAFNGRTGHFDIDDLVKLASLSALSRAFEGVEGVAVMPLTEILIRACLVRHRIDYLPHNVMAESVRLLCEWIEDAHPQVLFAHEAALIANMSTRAVQNDWRKQEVSGGLMPLREGVEWLKRRNGYRPTVPYEQDIQGEGTILVPFARDGTWFASLCRRRDGYRIGDKGSEKVVSDIYEALEALKDMDVAKWRRPNEQGNWGLVSAVEWRDIPLEEFIKVED